MTRPLQTLFATSALALAIAATPAQAGTPYTGQSESFEASFTYDASKSAKDNLAVFGRIADKHCRVDDHRRDVKLHMAAETCRKDLMDKAVAGIGRAELAAVHSGDAIFTRTMPTAVLSSAAKADAACTKSRRET